MEFFVFILTNNIVPIFVLIILGYWLGRKFELDVFTLSKLNFYVFVPAFILVNLYTTEIPLQMVQVPVFALSLMVLNFAVSSAVAKVRRYDMGMASAFKNSIMFYNSGNIGLPLITLVFSNPPFAETGFLSTAVTAQILVLMILNVTMNTVGFFNAGRATMRWQDSVLKVLTMPVIYAIPAAFFFKAVPYDLTDAIVWPALAYAREGLISVALLTLGAQLSRTTLRVTNAEVYVAAGVRLLGGPVMAWGLLQIMGIGGVLAQALMISSAVPTAVNSALIAVEMNNEPGFASQVVMVSTLCSAVTLTLVIYGAQLLFPF